MEGRNFGDVPLNVELKLEVWDSPNSAGVIIDAVRCAKVALDRGIGGPIIGPSAYFMKSPPIQFHDDVAHDMVEAFADGGAENIVWPSADVLVEALADVEVEAEAVVAMQVVSSTPATPGSSDTLFTRG
jgi:hypothetical protein